MISHARVLGTPDQTEPYTVNGVTVDPADTVQPSDWDAEHDVDVPALAAAMGATRLVDLGTVTATDLLGGPMVLLDDPDVYVLAIHGIGQATATDTGYIAVFPFATSMPHPPDISDANPVGQVGPSGYANQPQNSNDSLRPGRVIAVLLDMNGSYPVLGPWAADTPYAAADVIVVDGSYWQADNDGTSGATLPDFAGVEGNELQDNEVLWFHLSGQPPTTTGSAHFAALVAPLATP